MTGVQTCALPILPSDREVQDYSTPKTHRDNFGLIDRLTVTFGYAELVEMYPGNAAYQHKFQQALGDLSTIIETMERTFSDPTPSIS